MKLLILGGTAWLGREVTRQALGRGHEVWCLARGESGAVADGATLVRADRGAAGAYDQVRERSWDAVLDVSWQPGMVRSAVAALGERADHWVYVSSGSVYAAHDVIGADESAATLTPAVEDTAGIELYGEAKVACEQAFAGVGALIARAGLIGGLGDRSDRAGYWVARAARDPHGPMLVPADDSVLTAVIDVRDLAAFLLLAAETKLTGTYDTVGETVTLARFIASSRRIGGHTGATVAVDSDWLVEAGVPEVMGEESLALWIADPQWRGFGARSGAAARKAGLMGRPLEETLSDTLAWERELGLDRPRRAGLSPAREAELLGAWRG